MKKGDTFHHRFTVSENIYKGFIALFNDKNPLHCDESFAALKGFEGVVMHGNILNGFLSYFIGECLPIKNVIIHFQEIKYHNPVYLNEALDFFAVVSNTFESVNALEFKYYFENQQKIKVAQGKIQIGII